MIRGTLSNIDQYNSTRPGRFADDHLLQSLVPGQPVQLNLDADFVHGQFDTYLQLINADTGEVIAYDDDSDPGYNSELTFTPLQGVDYIARVTSFGNNVTGNYTLTTSILPTSYEFRLDAEADTYIRTDLSLRRNDNYGMQQFINVGTSRGGDGRPYGSADAMRSLIRFDLSYVSSALPINQAILELTVHSFSGTPSDTYHVNVHRIDPVTGMSWEEGNGFEGSIGQGPTGSTHPDPAHGVAWVGAGDGGDANNQTQPHFDPTIIASATIEQNSLNVGDVIQLDITSLVQGWINGSIENHGIMLVDPTTNGTFRELRFGSQEGNNFGFPDAVDGPTLVLN